MMNASDKINSGLKLVAIMIAAAIATGCVSAKSKLTDSAESAPIPATSATETASSSGASSQPSDSGDDSFTLESWTVLPGDHLWGIAGVDAVFGMSEQWPLLYKRNLARIDDADLIYPGQVLQIPRGHGQDEIDAAVAHARNRGPWALGPAELSDRDYLRNAP